MKAIRSVSFSLLAAVLIAGSAFAQTSGQPSSSLLDSLEKRMTESETREKQILENQAKILDELHKLRILVRRS